MGKDNKPTDGREETRIVPPSTPTPAPAATPVPPLSGGYSSAGSSAGSSGRPAASKQGIGLIGREVGPYHIVAELGAGGMGAVYLADQFQPVRRQVALKLIHAGMETTDLLERFRSERDLLARMNHPNIAQVLDVGAADDGRLYFAMEYVPGVPLSDFCDRRGLDVENRLALFLQVCEGVQHAHQKGVIHRDLKPGNLMVADYHGRHLVKVIDFGIAKGLDDFGRLEPGTTRAGVPIGTPAYMSPEQAKGDASAIDTRTDVYALGGVLYKLLTDEIPIPEDVISRSTDVGLARALMESVIEPPSVRVANLGVAADSEWRRRMANDPSSHSRLLRGDLDWIVLKALEHDRDRRYASVSELAADVQRFLNHEPVLASPPSRVYKIRKFIARHRVFVAATAAVLVALVAGIVGTTWMAMEASAQRHLAELARAQAEVERDRAEAERSRARAVSGFLEEMIAAPDPWKLQGARIDARDVKVIDVLNDAVRVFEQGRVKDPALYGEIGVLLGRTLRRLGQLEPAEKVLRAAVDDLAATQSADSQPRAESVAELGLAISQMGDSKVAEATLQGLMEIDGAFEALPPDLKEETSRVLAELALEIGEAERAEKLARATLEQAIARHGEDSTAASGARSSLAWILGARGTWEEAEALAQAAYQAERRRLGPAHPQTVNFLGSIAALALRKGDYANAERRYREAAMSAEQVLGADHHETIGYTALRAAALDNGGRHEEAIELFRQLLPRYSRALGADHPDVLTVRSNFAIALRSAKQLDESEQELIEVLAKRRRVLGESHPETVRSLMFLAVVSRDRGDLERAEVLLGQAASLYAEINGPDHPETLMMENNHLVVMRDRGELTSAIEAYAELLPRAEAAFPADHWHLSAIRGNYGVALYRAGRLDDAGPLVLGAYRSVASQFEADDPRVHGARVRAEEYLKLAGRPLSELD